MRKLLLNLVMMGGLALCASVPVLAADKTIHDFSTIPSGDTADELMIWDLSGSVTRKISVANLLAITHTHAASQVTGLPVEIGLACSDETTAITTGTAKVTFRAPFAFTVTAVRASLTTASSSGTPTVDINEGGTSILGTKLTIDANEKTSTTAASAATITDSSIADDAEITIDVDVSGTSAAGLKVWILGTR